MKPISVQLHLFRTRLNREKPLEIESWMIDNNNFNKPAAESEPALEIEAWMLDENSMEQLTFI